MTEALRNWLLSVVATALFSGILLSLTPNGAARRTLRFLCGLLLVLAALGPAAKLDLERLDLSGLRVRTEEAGRRTENGSMELMAALIKERTEAYIWDKAAAVGFVPTRVEAEVSTAGAYPCPRAVRITAGCSPVQRQRLTKIIEEELAVPASEQEWSSG